ncbi:hypothetical protein LEP1GSC008_4458 [Leptospira kirschneri serovar Bulgarica str. Nikolaevo]|uniref:Uncharacterized protein n=1 Tax=Leptospira kirschneri serovar Bulgarica str. Nikolaevo TaxID=1240687 RepID=M6FDS5_9LEPT|nr:hypothetical protein LEP1GSC008_4458 [Leptospira kirschneri serovar Bulgarica str. Nikolaevo]
MELVFQPNGPRFDPLREDFSEIKKLDIVKRIFYIELALNDI